MAGMLLCDRYECASVANINFRNSYSITLPCFCSASEAVAVLVWVARKACSRCWLWLVRLDCRKSSSRFGLTWLRFQRRGSHTSMLILWAAYLVFCPIRWRPLVASPCPACCQSECTQLSGSRSCSFPRTTYSHSRNCHGLWDHTRSRYRLLLDSNRWWWSWTVPARLCPTRLPHDYEHNFEALSILVDVFDFLNKALFTKSTPIVLSMFCVNLFSCIRHSRYCEPGQQVGLADSAVANEEYFHGAVTKLEVEVTSRCPWAFVWV